MRLPAGVLVELPSLVGDSLVWWPATHSGVSVEAEEGRRERVSRQRVCLGPRGEFVRQWGTRGEGEGQFKRPYGVCVSGGEVSVCDSGNHRVQVFGLDGGFLRQWGTLGEGEGQFVYPSGVCVSDGEVFVTDSDNDRVQVFGLDGGFLRQWGTEGEGEGQFDRPRGVCVSDREVFVCDAGNHRVQVFR